MMLCDAVQTDAATGKVTVFGSFTAVTAKSYPAVHPVLHVFLELTDGRGETPLALKICRVTADSIDGEELVRMEWTTHFRDPRVVHRLTLGVTNVHIPTSGEYRFILETSAGVLIAERRLVAAQVP